MSEQAVRKQAIKFAWVDADDSDVEPILRAAQEDIRFLWDALAQECALRAQAEQDVSLLRRERDEALRSAALREMEAARASEYRAQLNDVTGRLIAQRRRLRELEELQAGESSWQRERADEAVVRLREYEAALRQACTNLGTIRPLDMLRDGEHDISLGEASDRWRDLVLEQGRAAVAASGGREA